MQSDMAPTGAPRGVRASIPDVRQTYSDDTSRVAVLHWPRDRHQRAALQSTRSPRLLLVADGSPPPPRSDEFEDWTRSAPGSAEYEARVTELERRSRTAAPDVRLSGRRLQRGPRQVTMTTAQCLAIVPLLRLAGRPVSRSVVTDALATAGVMPSAAAVRALLTRLDRLVAPLGLRVWLLSGRAALLEVLPLPDDGVHPYVTSTKSF